jgi:hypothetical protein
VHEFAAPRFTKRNQAKLAVKGGNMKFMLNALMLLVAGSVGIAAFVGSSGLTAWMLCRARREKESGTAAPA